MGQRLRASDWIAYHARTAPGSLACRDAASGRAYTYAQFDDRIARLTTALVRRFAVVSGERLLVLSRNDSDVFEIQFACQRSGAIFVPLNWRLAAYELQLIARDADAKILFYDSAFRETAERLCATATIAHAVELRAGRPSDYEACQAEPAAPQAGIGPELDAVWALLYTSGTTGMPKGAQITYGMALCNAIVLGSAFGIGADSRNLVILPTFHTGGLNVFANPVFFHGGANVVLRDFDPGLVVRLLADPENRISHLLGVPTVHAALAVEPGLDRLGPAGLPGLCIAGAPCPPALIERYAALGLSLRQCWGMTEVGPLALIMPARAPRSKQASCGFPSMFARLAIVDGDGVDVPAGQIGELVVRGPVVTPGYWRQPAITAQSFRNGGWFRTGDAAYRDNEGYHFIVDRWKDMFISGGENIYPAEIERVLALLPDVMESAVVGMPDDTWGEVGRAFVVRSPSSAIDEERLRAHCQHHLARYKVPRQFLLVDVLPRNAAGKVLKAELRRNGGAIAHIQPISEVPST